MSPPEALGPPPWIDPTMQQSIPWRDRDIVISVPIKSGTTWTMNIVHQLLSGGDPNFEDIYAEVPWIEILKRPGMPLQELLDDLAAMPTGRPRAFKTHAAPPTIPYVSPDDGTDVRYVVVCRNPEEALVSIKPFLEQHTDAWYDLWRAPRGALTRPDFKSFYYDVASAMGMHAMLFGFLAAWWPLRHQDNVLMIHFADMKRDHEGLIRGIADFLDISPSDETWGQILEYTSFPWMKRHGVKFDGTLMGDVPVLTPGAMVRKGATGAAHEDGMTPAIADHIREVGSTACPDEDARRWFYEGGDLGVRSR